MFALRSILRLRSEKHAAPLRMLGEREQEVILFYRRTHAQDTYRQDLGQPRC